MPLFFTPSQANALLPQVKKILGKIIEIKKATEKLNDDTETARAMERLQREIEKLEDMGGVLKDPNIGLVDFPAVRLGVRVWLCWKLGEETVAFWHTLHDGFTGRKSVQDNKFYEDDLAIKTLTGEAPKPAE